MSQPPQDPPQIHPSVSHLLDQFAYDHLPEGKIRETSSEVNALAWYMVTRLGNSPELSFGLRQLLLAKDAFVRQAVIDARR